MTEPDPIELVAARRELYRERERRFSDEAQRLGASSRLYSNLRGLSFAVLVVASIVAVVQASFLPAGAVALGACIAFAVLVVRHGRVLGAEDDKRRAALVNRPPPPDTWAAFLRRFGADESSTLAISLRDSALQHSA